MVTDSACSDQNKGQIHDAENASAVSADPLVEQICLGDRKAAAAFVTQYERMLRRRIRAQLGASMRRLFDSDDVFSTVCRRLDACVASESVRARSLPELLTLLTTIARNSIIDKGRILRRFEIVEREDSDFAHAFRSHAERHWASDADPNIDVDRCLSALANPRDREILLFWLAGRSHGAIAQELGLSAELVRKRWQLIKEQIRSTLVLEE